MYPMLPHDRFGLGCFSLDGNDIIRGFIAIGMSLKFGLYFNIVEGVMSLSHLYTKSF